MTTCVVSHPSHKNKNAARVGHPAEMPDAAQRDFTGEEDGGLGFGEAYVSNMRRVGRPQSRYPLHCELSDRAELDARVDSLCFDNFS
jgi:hypothetical protein